MKYVLSYELQYVIEIRLMYTLQFCFDIVVFSILNILKTQCIMHSKHSPKCHCIRAEHDTIIILSYVNKRVCPYGIYNFVHMESTLNLQQIYTDVQLSNNLMSLSV